MKKPHRYRPGTVALREIRRYQKSTELLIRYASITSVVLMHQAHPRLLANCLSSDWCVRSLRTSRPTFDSNRRPSVPSRKPLKLTLSPCSKTPTCAPSTPSVSRSCQRTSSWLAESVVNDHKFPLLPPKEYLCDALFHTMHSLLMDETPMIEIKSQTFRKKEKKTLPTNGIFQYLPTGILVQYTLLHTTFCLSCFFYPIMPHVQRA